MTAIYGARWVSAMGASPEDAAGKLTVAGDTWAQGLAGLTGDQLACGLRACVHAGDGWPPSLPEFRLSCMGVPTIADTRHNLREKFEDFHPFTLMVYRRLDYWNYQRAEIRQGEKMLLEAYEEARAAVLRGEPMPQKPQLVTHTPQAPKPADPEIARRAINEMREACGRVAS